MVFLKRLLIYILLMVAALTSCNADKSRQSSTPVATLDPRIATPQIALVEEPLHGKLIDIPEVWVTSSRQSKRALINYLYKPQEPEAVDKLLRQLEWVNPGLSDPILPGTLVVIPPVYRVSQSEPLSAIAKTMGLSEELMRAANPKLTSGVPLAEGTAILLPRLYVVTQDTLLSAAVDALQTNDEDLILANPGLAEQSEIRAGTVLVVPLQEEKRP